MAVFVPGGGVRRKSSPLGSSEALITQIVHCTPFHGGTFQANPRG